MAPIEGSWRRSRLWGGSFLSYLLSATRATDGRPYETKGKRGECVGAVIDRPNGKHMKKKDGEEGR